MSAVAAAARARAVAVPAWVWLAGIVVCSAAIRIALARRMVAPWIMVDELVYSELAKSFAAQGSFLLRDVPSSGYGFVYPVLIAPAWALFQAVPDAYAAAKAINGVLMSLAAVPAYLLARRLLTPGLALVVAALSVAVPSMLYTGTVMTENAFYPVFLLAALALVAALERPTPLRQLALLAACGLAYATRAQAVFLLASVVAAPPLLALAERRPLRAALRPFAVLYGTLAAAAAAALVVVAARGDSPLSLLGAYRAATESDYEPVRALRFLVYHVAELDLYLGVVPFACLLALWLAARALPAAARTFAVASLSLVAPLVVLVAVFASQPSVDKIEERNMFYVAPLALTALVVVCSGRALPRRPALVAAAAVAGILPVLIPFERFITTSAVADTFALLPWWWVQDHLVSLDQVRFVALAVSLVAAALLVLLPRRLGLLLPALVAAAFVTTSFVVENGRHGIHRASLGKLWAGIRVEHRDWIDREVGAAASVAVLRTGKTSDEAVWENEFFNRSLGRVYSLTERRPDPLPETRAVRGDDGRLRAGGEVVTASYALADGSVELAGSVEAADPGIGLRLYRVDGPLVVLSRVEGLYDDTWSRRAVSYERVDCDGGSLTVALASDASLFRGNQVVVARTPVGVARRAVVPPTGESRLTVPLEPGPDGRCRVRFEVARTAVPARVIPGSEDERVLGAHFLSFEFRPAS